MLLPGCSAVACSRNTDACAFPPFAFLPCREVRTRTGERRPPERAARAAELRVRSTDALRFSYRTGPRETLRPALRGSEHAGRVGRLDCTPSGSQTLAFRRREGQVKSRHATIPPRQPARAAASKLTSSGPPKYRLSVASCTIPDDITNAQEREPVGDDGRFQSTPLEPLAFQARVVQCSLEGQRNVQPRIA